MMLNWEQHFEERPCQPALDWIEENGIETMSEAWEKCERGDWLVWALVCRDDEYALTGKQRVEIAVKVIRETPVGDGRTVFDLLTDERSINAIEVAERYIAGEASDGELREAVAAAHAAASVAAAGVAVAAAAGVVHAASVAAADAATARKAQADIIRQWWPVWSPEGEIAK